VESVRDVIVVGAGGGGAVIAKELAARGLDVLLLEAGARFADPERETGTTSRVMRTIPSVVIFASARGSVQAWLGKRAASKHSVPATLGCRRNNQPLSGQLAAGDARQFRWLRRLGS
jgi:choline dehydrogenase-like flavoprotein